MPNRILTRAEMAEEIKRISEEQASLTEDQRKTLARMVAMSFCGLPFADEFFPPA